MFYILLFIYSGVFFAGLAFLPRTIKIFKTKDFSLTSGRGYEVITAIHVTTILITALLFFFTYDVLKAGHDAGAIAFFGYLISGFFFLVCTVNLISFLTILYHKYFKWNKKI